jgi:hypothetical protein
MAAESGKKWWQFGQGQQADVTATPQAAPMNRATSQPWNAPEAGAVTTPIDQPSTLDQPLDADQPEPHWMLSSPLAKVSWPRLHMPEVPKPKMPAAPFSNNAMPTTNKNAWAVPNAQPPLKPSPMQRFGQSTRNAWHKTVDALTPGDDSKSGGPSSRVARRDDRSVWQKMFGSDEPKKKEGSQTIGEFIAQDRIDP